MSEYTRNLPEENTVHPIASAAGIGCYILALPAAIIGLLELLDILDYGEIGAIIDSIIFTASSLAILIGSGLSLTGALKDDTAKVTCGGSLIALSSLDLIRRIISINDNLNYWNESFSEAIKWAWVHEQMELSFLGMLIGIFILTRK